MDGRRRGETQGRRACVPRAEKEVQSITTSSMHHCPITTLASGLCKEHDVCEEGTRRRNGRKTGKTRRFKEDKRVGEAET